MKRRSREQWVERVVENTAVVPDERSGDESLFELMQAARIRCHSGGTCHSASVCLSCPRFVAGIAATDRTSVRIQCWWHADPPVPRRGFAEGSGMLELPGLACASCGAREEVARHPKMSNVDICRSCYETSLEPIDYTELGTGD